jgi:hypothetical protein
VWIKNCDPPYAIFKRLNLEPKTQIGWKLKERKSCSMQILTKNPKKQKAKGWLY